MPGVRRRMLASSSPARSVSSVHDGAVPGLGDLARGPRAGSAKANGHSGLRLARHTQRGHGLCGAGISVWQWRPYPAEPKNDCQQS
jgi:hypothetical protein